MNNLFKSILAAGGILMSQFAMGQSANMWNNTLLNEENRVEDHAHFFAYETKQLAQQGDKSRSGRYLSLEGDWKFDWVKNADERPADFYTLTYDDSKWGKMPVPGIWELNGYGNAVYVNSGWAWRNDFKVEPPFIGTKGNHVGSYRRTFQIPSDWKGQKMYVHIGSVTSCVYLYVNGKYVGYSEDSKVAAEFDVTKFLKPGQDNLIAMQVFRWCDGSWGEDQDFWRLCGIARECYIYATPQKHIVDYFVTPDLVNGYRDGQLNVKFSASGVAGISMCLTDAEGKTVCEDDVTLKSGKADVNLAVSNPRKWSAEDPYLYTLFITAKDKKGNATEVIPQKVGFRKVEIKNAQLLVNGQPILIKGADRHEIDPDYGYVISRERMIDDIKMMKELNMNAVRTCHYPDDPRWYELCDEMGIYVTSESNLETHGMGYGKETLAIRDDFHLMHMQRQYHHMKTYKNYPCIIVWSLGNEAGYGKNFSDAYDWVKSYDSSRPCQYERALWEHDGSGKSDIMCPMYYDYSSCERYCEGNDQRPLIQCEYAHAMGNSMGGFKEYWDLVRKYPKYQGGYIWDLIDQGLRDKSKVTGRQIWTYGGDYGENRPSDNNFNCNGVVAPDRTFNPHAYEVQYYYQNIWSTVEGNNLSIYNENFFVPITGQLHWTVSAEGKEFNGGIIDLDGLSIQPQTSKSVTIPLSQALEDKTYEGKEITLNVSYVQDARQIAHQQFVLREYSYPSIESVGAKTVKGVKAARMSETADSYTFTTKHVSVRFNKATGFIDSYVVDGSETIEQGSAITPDFWRAPTDNDHGAGLQRRLRAWRNPTFRLDTLGVKTVGQNVSVVAQYTIPEVSASLTMTYRITVDGRLVIDEDMKVDANAEHKPQLLRFGMKMDMPQKFEQISFYGKGPHENYCDRNGSADLGIYSQTVAEQYYGYIRPQESGNKTQVRWWQMINYQGRGIRFYSSEPMECQAISYNYDDLDPQVNKAQFHSGDLTPRSYASVHIAQKEYGIGCVNSWGALPRKEYQLPYQDYHFVFVAEPLY